MFKALCVLCLVTAVLAKSSSPPSSCGTLDLTSDLTQHCFPQDGKSAVHHSTNLAFHVQEGFWCSWLHFSLVAHDSIPARALPCQTCQLQYVPMVQYKKN